MDRLIIVFLKWPEPGKVKTRLAKSLGSKQAAAVYRQLVHQVALHLGDYATTDLAICFTPADRETELRDWLTPIFQRTIQHWWPQDPGNLGDRQHQAFQRATESGYRQTAIIGTDCLDLTPAIFDTTWRALERHHWMLGPTKDGGYYLIAGQNSANHAHTWESIRWSTEHTLRDLVTNLDRAQQTHLFLEIMNDVDDYEDWISIKDRLTIKE